MKEVDDRTYAIWDEELDKILYAIANDWWDRIFPLGDLVAREIIQESKKKKIDPRYVMFILQETKEVWFSMGPKKTAVKAAIEMYIWTGEGLDWSYFDMPEIEQQKQVDDIIRHFTQWSSTTFVKKAREGLLRAIMDHVPEIQKVNRLVGIKENTISTVKVALTLLEEKLDKDSSFIRSPVQSILRTFMKKLFK